MRIVLVSAVLTLAAATSVLPGQVAGAQAPSTTVVLPFTDATLSGLTQYLDAVATSGATQLQYELSGGSLSNSVIATATPTFVGWAAAWNTTSVANGTYALNSVASYPGGVTATSAPITITVDNAPPSTTVVYPTSGATRDDSVTQYFDAVAAPGVTQVTINVDAPSTGVSYSFTAIPTYVGWIAVEDGTPIPPGACGPIGVPATVESVASYAGGVSGTSAPVSITEDAYTSLPGGGC
jgi:hypothetical protein